MRSSPGPVRARTRRCSRSSSVTSGAPWAGRPATADRSPRSTGSSLFFGVGLPMSPEIGEAILRRTGEVRGALSPWAAQRAYLNFAERAD